MGRGTFLHTRKAHMAYLVILAYLKYTWASRKLWADVWRACQRGFRWPGDLGNRDFLQIGDRLVFLCLRIIPWWRDVMQRCISDRISSGFYSCQPCPWTSRPCPKLFPHHLSFTLPCGSVMSLLVSRIPNLQCSAPLNSAPFPHALKLTYSW